MLIKNEEGSTRKRLVNGSRGKVIGFLGDESFVDDPSLEDDGDDASDEGGDESSSGRYPIVQFRGGRRKVIRPVKFESRIVGLGTCVREAVPLKLAWAVTMHKSQGLTLDYVKADVGGVFTEAQAYVALSRATDETGLEIRNFSPRVVRANKRALAFYSNPHGLFNSWDDPKEPSCLASIASVNENSRSSSLPPAQKNGSRKVWHL